MAIGILGMGVSGIAALKLAVSKQIEVYAINQDAAPTWTHYADILELLERRYLVEQDEAYDLQIDELILSPGIAPETALVEHFKMAGVRIISEIEFASRYIKTPIIGVTGTNGKTTTCTLLQKALELCGKKTYLGGNIGIALSLMPLDKIEYDFAVVELSSFQLESISEFAPKVACVLNISKSHSERYDDPKDYALAKFNITKNLNDDGIFIYPKDCFVVKDKVSALNCEKVELSPLEIEELKSKLDFSHQKAIGGHYPEMYTFIFHILKAVGLDATDAIQKLIDTFTGLEHRIEFVKEGQGYRFYNDSKSTNMAATINAVNSFNEPVQLILGGQLRDRDISSVELLLQHKDKLKSIILFGESSQSIQAEYGAKFDFKVASSFEEAFHCCEKGIVLYSPAFPSFDMFKNYSHRGKSFKEAVNNFIN